MAIKTFSGSGYTVKVDTSNLPDGADLSFYHTGKKGSAMVGLYTVPKGDPKGKCVVDSTYFYTDSGWVVLCMAKGVLFRYLSGGEADLAYPGVEELPHLSWFYDGKAVNSEGVLVDDWYPPYGPQPPIPPPPPPPPTNPAYRDEQPFVVIRQDGVYNQHLDITIPTSVSIMVKANYHTMIAFEYTSGHEGTGSIGPVGDGPIRRALNAPVIYLYGYVTGLDRTVVKFSSLREVGNDYMTVTVSTPSDTLLFMDSHGRVHDTLYGFWMGSLY